MKLFLAEPFASKWENIDPFKEVFLLAGEVYRDMGDRCTSRFEVDGKAYFVKTHIGVGWLEILKNLFCLRRPILGAENEYQAIVRLGELGIKTMVVKAFGSSGWNPAKKKSFLITEALEPTKPLDEYCNSATLVEMGAFQRRSLVRRLAEISRALHENGINHRDYYLCHFLVDISERHSKDSFVERPISLIDLHRAQIRQRAPRRWRHKDLSALYYSANRIGFDRKDMLCFIREYKKKSLRDTLQNDCNFWESIVLQAKNLHQKGVRKGYHS